MSSTPEASDKDFPEWGGAVDGGGGVGLGEPGPPSVRRVKGEFVNVRAHGCAPLCVLFRYFDFT